MRVESKSSNSMFKVTIAALGIVFGDIGTSPLYALRVCFSGEHGLSVSAGNAELLARARALAAKAGASGAR